MGYVKSAFAMQFQIVLPYTSNDEFVPDADFLGIYDLTKLKIKMINPP